MTVPIARANPKLSPPRVRTPIDRLDDVELAQLRDAFKSAQDSGKYQEIAGISGLPLPLQGQNGNLLFLPWNRAYLWQFETALALLAPGFSLPYWDWTAPASQRVGIPPAFAVESVGGAPNPLCTAKVDPRALTEGGGSVPASTIREPRRPDAPALPTAEDVGAVLALADFASFSAALEQLSNAVHIFVGGHMGQVAYSAYDPLFWVHGAMVDQIWRTWQRTHPTAPPPSELLTETLAPWSITVTGTLDPTALGYDYRSRADPDSTRVLSGATNDRPALEDSLGFHHYATAFAELIASPETTPPLTIGIFGSWGMGKSTLLESIVREIETGQDGTTQPEDRDQRTLKSSALFVHVVRFNAWDYAREEAIWPALVRETMGRLRTEIRWSRRARFLALFRRNLRRTWKRHASRIVVTAVLVAFAAVIAAAQLGFNSTAIGLGVVGLGVGGVLKVATETFTNPAGQWLATLFAETDYGQRLVQLEAIRDDLAFLVAQLNQQAEVERRVLVIIDDLDRCEPSKVVEVLQAVNRLLDSPSFIVCMGVDARVVTAAIAEHYEGLLAKSGASGFEYLDKIVQIPFRIPEPDSEAMSAFLETQVPTAAEIVHQEQLATESANAAPRRPQLSQPGGSMSDEYRVAAPEAGLGEGALGQRVAFKPAELRAFKDLSDFLRPNPRHVKRLINVYRLVRTFAESKRREETMGGDAQLVLDHPDATIRWLLISAQWPYTASGMLRQHRQLKREWNATSPPMVLGQRPLELLYARATERLVPETQNRFDDDIDRLAALIEGVDIEWKTFEAISRYTVNFNPSVEEELRLERLRSENVAAAGNAPKRTSRPASSRSRRKPSATRSPKQADDTKP